jgi:hypothetical protein
VQVKLGSAFDVVGERKQADYRVDTAAKWIEEDIEVRVRNQKPDETVTVIVKDAGHSMKEPGIRSELVQATDDFANL